MAHLTAALAAAQSAMERLKLEWQRAAEQQQEQHHQELLVQRKRLEHAAGGRRSCWPGPAAPPAVAGTACCRRCPSAGWLAGWLAGRERGVLLPAGPAGAQQQLEATIASLQATNGELLEQCEALREVGRRQKEATAAALLTAEQVSAGARAGRAVACRSACWANGDQGPGPRPRRSPTPRWGRCSSRWLPRRRSWRTCRAR